jgi:enoyl-CoA hydratase
MSNEIIVDRSGPGLAITFNRPDHGNAMSDAAAAELTSLLSEKLDTAAYVVLRGAGDDFCVGRATMGVRPAGPDEALQRRRNSEVIFDCYAAFRRAPVPVIGVVQGRALGFGCALAGLCDITIASETARFQIPEMAHNILPTMVLSALVDRVPRKALTYLVYSMAEISAMRALAIGLVSEVVPAGELEAALEALLGALLKAPRPALCGIKEYARCAFAMDTQGAVDFARNLHATINSSSEMRKKP